MKLPAEVTVKVLELAGETPPAPPVRRKSLGGEAGFLEAVIELARLRGFKVAHFRGVRVQRADGSTFWQTPTAADAAGWPDLFLVRPRDGRLLIAELKAGKNRRTPAQVAWAEAFAAAGLTVREWRPEHWPEIEAALA